MRQLTALDAQFLAGEDGAAHGHFCGFGFLDPSDLPGGRLERERVRDLIADRIHLIPPFRWRLAEVPLGIDLPYWVEDEEIDLDRHVLETRLPEGASEAAAVAAAERIIGEPLDRSRPLWELHLIQGMADGRVGWVTKVHHATSDGVSGGELLAMLFDQSPGGRRLPDAADRLRPAPGRLEMLARGVAGLPRQPLRALRSVRVVPHLDQVTMTRVLPGVQPLAAVLRRAGRVLETDSPELLEPPRVVAPRTRFNGPIDGSRRIAYTTTPLGEVKAIKTHYGVTVNDVVVAIAAGALRRFLEDRGELPEQPLAAMVPVSVRSDEERGTFGNRIAMMIPPVYTDEPDATKRLLRTHEAMRAAKERHRAVPASMMQDTVNFIPPVMLARAARLTASIAARYTREPPANLILSNVPGPPASQYLAGARVTAFFPASAVFHGLGLNVTVFSYVDELQWGAVCDGRSVEDLAPLAEAIEVSQAELLATLPA